MTRAELYMLRNYIKSEIEAAIADIEEDSEGYRGCGYSEKKEADRLFNEIVDYVDRDK